jgi:hypothetical protein
MEPINITAQQLRQYNTTNVNEAEYRKVAPQDSDARDRLIREARAMNAIIRFEIATPDEYATIARATHTDSSTVIEIGALDLEARELTLISEVTEKQKQQILADRKDTCTYTVGMIMAIVNMREAHKAAVRVMKEIFEEQGGEGEPDGALVFVEAREHHDGRIGAGDEYTTYLEMGYKPMFTVKLNPGDPRGEYGLYAVVGADKEQLAVIYDIAKAFAAHHIMSLDLVGQVMKETGLGKKNEA